MKYISLAFIILSTLLNAQIQHPGTPMGRPTKTLRSTAESTITLPAFTPPKQHIDDNAIRHKTLTFAHPFKVNISPDNAGQWYTTAEGQRIWQVSIYSENAASLNLIFSKFKLPEGGQLFIYNKTMSHIIGAFTHLNNKASGVLPTLPIDGDFITVEYQAPLNSTDDAAICISSINHDFYGIYEKVGKFGDAASCESDVTCYLNEAYQISKRSTVKLIIDGTELMTGTLINNSKNDGKPYIITASHGFVKHNMNAASTLFIFNYQVPHCITNIEGSREQAIAGGEMLCYSPNTNDNGQDFALLKMSARPPVIYRPVYAGWSRSSTPPSQVHCVHHPLGDVKKISFDDDSLVIGSLTLPEVDYRDSAHWKVKIWDEGITEGGSSGSAIFNAKSQFLGALSGGAATCSHPRNDFFYRMDMAWDAPTNTDSTLSQWLDSDNSGLEELPYFIPKEVAAIEQRSHISSATNITAVRGDTFGNIAGNNTLGITRFVEKFEANDSTYIYGFSFVPSDGTAQSYVNVNIWSGTHKPEKQVYAEPLLIKHWGNAFPASISGNIGGYYTKPDLALKENLVHFASPVGIKGTFFVGFEVDNSRQDYPFGLTLNNTDSEDNAYYYDGTWHSYSELEGYNKTTSLWIEPIISNSKNNAIAQASCSVDEIKIWPNPVSKNQMLNVNAQVTSSIRIYSIDGKYYPCPSQKNQSYTSINTSLLCKGTYIIKIDSKAFLFIKK